MKNKILKFMILFISIVGLSSCSIEPHRGYAHVEVPSRNEPIHLKLSDSGHFRSETKGEEFELHTENFGTILISKGTYVLYDSMTCPICGEVEYR